MDNFMWQVGPRNLLFTPDCGEQHLLSLKEVFLVISLSSMEWSLMIIYYWLIYLLYLFIYSYCLNSSHLIITLRGNVGWEACQGSYKLVTARNQTPDPLIQMTGWVQHLYQLQILTQWSNGALILTIYFSSPIKNILCCYIHNPDIWYFSQGHLWYSGSTLDCWSIGWAIDPAPGA